MRVLVVDDERRLASFLSRGEARASPWTWRTTATDGLWLCPVSIPYDAIVLDLNAHGLNGYQVCERPPCGEVNWTPILMLTARDGDWDQVEGLYAVTTT